MTTPAEQRKKIREIAEQTAFRMGLWKPGEPRGDVQSIELACISVISVIAESTQKMQIAGADAYEKSALFSEFIRAALAQCKKDLEDKG